MVPMGMIKKMYGASAKMEALNTVVSENLNKHIFDNKLDLLGYPLSDIELQQPADLEKEDDMDFYFEAALRPEINIDFTNTMVDFYHIVPTDEEVDKVIEDLLQRNPNTSHPETVGEDDRLEIKVREAKDGKEVEGGFEKDGVYFNMSQIKNKTQRKKFIDKEVGAEFIVNFAKVFGSEEEAAKILGNDAPAGSDFNIIIDDAIRNEKPELDEEFFKKIFPDKEIKDLDAFKKAVKAEMEKQHEAETDPILFNKMIDELVAAVKFDLPDAFMKRWIVDNSQGKISAEDIEKNYDNDYVKGLRWQLIEDAIVKANPELVIKDEEVKDFVLKQIFPGIDYATLEDDMKANLDKIAANYLKDEQQVNGLKNQLADIKMTAFLKGKMNINYAETTSADFVKKLEGECAEGTVRQRAEETGGLFRPKKIGDDDAKAAFVEGGRHGGDSGARAECGVEIRMEPIERCVGGGLLFPDVRRMPDGKGEACVLRGHGEQGGGGKCGGGLFIMDGHGGGLVDDDIASRVDFLREHFDHEPFGACEYTPVQSADVVAWMIVAVFREFESVSRACSEPSAVQSRRLGGG